VKSSPKNGTKPEYSDRFIPIHEPDNWDVRYNMIKVSLPLFLKSKLMFLSIGCRQVTSAEKVKRSNLGGVQKWTRLPVSAYE